MLAISLNASVPVEDVRRYDAKHTYSFWTFNKSIVLASNTPFSRYDLVDIEKSTDYPNVFVLEPRKWKEVSTNELSNIGVLMMVSTDIPISHDADYHFDIEQGIAEKLIQQKAEMNEQVYYLFLLHIKTPEARMIGRDHVYGDELEFVFDLHKEFELIKDSVNTSIAVNS